MAPVSTLCWMRWFVVALTLLLASCAGGAREVGDGGDGDSVLRSPQTDLSADDAVWVDFEARWICDRDRSTYPDPAAVETALADRLATEGLSGDDYASFVDRLSSDTNLALHVQAAAVQRCGAG